MQSMMPSNLEERVAAIKVLIVDDEPSMRRVVRAMLGAVGVKRIYDASDGAAGIEAIRVLAPDIVIVDWEMPTLDGMHFVRLVRSNCALPAPDVPIIMLTGHGDRWRVVEAANAGINEYLLKPVSTKALCDRIVSILTQPREMVRVDGYYTPGPRRPAAAAPEPKAQPEPQAKAWHPPRTKPVPKPEPKDRHNIVLLS